METKEEARMSMLCIQNMGDQYAVVPWDNLAGNTSRGWIRDVHRCPLAADKKKGKGSRNGRNGQMDKTE